MLIQQEIVSEKQQPKEQIDKQIKDLVSKLSSEDFSIREDATRRLIELGMKNPTHVKKALLQALEQEELEIRIRARHILDEIPWQLYKRIGHGRIIDFVFYSHAQLAVFSGNGMIEIWDIDTQKLVKSIFIEKLIEEPRPQYDYMMFSHSGKILAMVLFEKEEKILSLIDIFTGKEINKIKLPVEMHISDMQFSADENFLAVNHANIVTNTNKIEIWDLKQKKLEKTIGSHSMHKICFISNTQLLGSCPLSGKAIVWNIITGEKIKVLERKINKYCGSIAISPDKKFLALTSKNWDPNGIDALAEIYDVNKWTKITSLHGNWITSISFSPDSRLLVLMDIDRIKIIDVNTWELLFSVLLRKVPHPLTLLYTLKTEIRFSPDSNFLAILNNDTIKILDIKTGKQKMLLPGYQKEGNLCFSPDSKFLATETKVWDVQNEKEIKIFEDASNLFIFNNGNFIRIVENTIEVYDTKTWRRDKVINLDNKKNEYSLLSGNGKLLVLASKEEEINIVDLESGALVKRLTLKCEGGGSIVAIDISPDGNFLYVGTTEGVISLWDIKNEELIQVHSIDSIDSENRIKNLRFSHDGEILVITTLKYKKDRIYVLKVFKMNSKNISTPLDITTAKIIVDISWPTAICISPDNNLIAASLYSGVIQIWQR